MDNSKPLYSLTIEEYIELNKTILTEQVDRFLQARLALPASKHEEDIIFIDDAVTLTGYKKSSIYSKVSKFEIPVLSRLRPLTFSKKALITWLNDGKPHQVYAVSKLKGN